MSNLNKYLQLYAEVFDDNFPMFLCRNKEEKEVIELIKNSIKTKTPYTVYTDANADY